MKKRTYLVIDISEQDAMNKTCVSLSDIYDNGSSNKACERIDFIVDQSMNAIDPSILLEILENLNLDILTKGDLE